MNRRILKIELDYPEVIFWRMRNLRRGYRYVSSSASWERLTAVLNARFEKAGIEATDIGRATFLV